MSVPFWVISCEHCQKNWQSTVNWGMYYYLLPDGRKVRAHNVMGWCHACDSFQPVEKIPEYSTLLAIEQEMELNVAVAREEKETFWQRVICRSADKKQFIKHRIEQLADVQAELLWLELRQSPPKCFTCGYDQIEQTDFSACVSDGKKEMAFRHPNCGEILSMRYTDYRISCRTKFFLYDVEGGFLESGYVR